MQKGPGILTDEDMNPSAEKIANNTVVLVAARISMALALPTISLLFWLYTGWQDDKLNAIRAQTTIAQNAASEASQKADKVSERLVAVETKQVQDAEAGQRFQNEMLGRMDRMQDAIVELSNSVSALTATVRALAENQRRERRTSP